MGPLQPPQVAQHVISNPRHVGKGITHSPFRSSWYNEARLCVIQASSEQLTAPSVEQVSLDQIHWFCFVVARFLI